MIRVRLLATTIVGALTLVTALMPGVAGGEQHRAPPAEGERVVVLLEPTSDAEGDAAEVASTAGDDRAEARRSVYPTLGVVPIHVASGRQGAVENHPKVRAVVRPGVTVTPTLAESVPHIGAAGRHSVGYTGSGRTVAVLDTGTHADFGGTIVGQACFVVLDGGSCGPMRNTHSAFDALCFDAGVCDIDRDTLDLSAGAPCPGGGEGCQHGTAVAAVAAGRTSSAPGVARGASVYPVRVFNDSGTTADLTDVLLGIGHVLEMHRAGAIDLSAVNLSLATSSLYGSVCDSQLDDLSTAFVDAFAALRRHGIVPVASTGNDGHPSAIGFPACLSNAVPVGASDLDDVVASFSNRMPGHTVLAPGADSASTRDTDELDIPVPTGYSTQWAGTSFSAPHVSGAMAVLDHEYPLSLPAHKEWLLDRGGRVVTDHYSSARYRRIGMGAPWDILAAGTFVPGRFGRGGPRAGVGDFDGDGQDDVFLHRPGTAADTVVHGRNDAWAVAPVSHAIDGDHQVLVGNFLGSAAGPDDALLYSPGPAGDHLWLGRSDRTFGVTDVSVRGTYETLVADFDGDGRDDIFWYAPGPPNDFIWYGGSTAMESHAAGVRGDYRVVAGDYDGDGRDDLFFHGPGSAGDHLWTATTERGRFVSSRLRIGGDYVPVTLDWDGNTPDDLLLYAAGSDTDFVWSGNTSIPTGGTRHGFGQERLSVNGTYQPVVGDVNADGFDDIVWYAPSSSQDHVWVSRRGDGRVSRAVSMPVDRLPRIGDVDGRGGDDLVFVDPIGSASRVWWSHTGP